MAVKRKDSATQLRSYKIRANGLRGLTLTLPATWTHDLDLSAGDLVGVARDADDRLILTPPKKAAS